MFSRFKTEGILLNSFDSGESDRFFIVYTADFGKIRVFAKSIRKSSSKLRFGANNFFLNSIEFIEGKKKRTLTDIQTINNYKRIRQSLYSSALALKACEDLDILTKEEEKDDGLWSLIKDFLSKLDESKNDKEAFSLYLKFIWPLFSLLGYEPDLNSCLSCNGEISLAEKIYFSAGEGGVVGSCCVDSDNQKRATDKREIDLIKKMIKGELEEIDSGTKENIKSISEDYIKHLSSR